MECVKTAGREAVLDGWTASLVICTIRMIGTDLGEESEMFMLRKQESYQKN